MQPLRYTWLRALPAAAALAACAATVLNPVTGERERGALSTSAAVRLGAEQAETVARHMGIVVDPVLRARVEAVGGRLAARSPRRNLAHHFAVADMAEPNVFSLPGGWIYVSRGLLPLLGSEAELAGVLAHAVGHVAALHEARRRAWTPGLGALLEALGGAGTPWAGRLLGAGPVAGHTDAQERLADRVGQALAAEAGFDPAGLPRVLATLERWSRVHPRSAQRLPDFIDTHPVTRQRIDAARERAHGLAVAPDAARPAPRARFLDALDGLLVGPHRGAGAFRGDVLVHPRLDLAMTFPAGWPRASGREAAVARAPDGDAVLALEAQGPPDDAVRAGRDWLARRPLRRLNEAEGTVNGLGAYQVRARSERDGQPTELLLTWIAHPRRMLRVTGASPGTRFHRFALQLDAAATSVRRLAPRDRAGLRERRLRVVRARAGESLAALCRRTRNAWSVEETAAANATAVRAPLGAGRRVKIAIESRWSGP